MLVGYGSNGSGITIPTLGECVCGLESIGGEGCNRAVEDFKANFVEHYTCNVDGPIPRIESLSKHCSERKS